MSNNSKLKEVWRWMITNKKLNAWIKDLGDSSATAAHYFKYYGGLRFIIIISTLYAITDGYSPEETAADQEEWEEIKRPSASTMDFVKAINVVSFLSSIVALCLLVWLMLFFDNLVNIINFFLPPTLVSNLVRIVCLLVAIAYYTLAERKIMGSIQRRRGPNLVGFWGLLQPLADGLKLIVKELVLPGHANVRIFVAAPVAVLLLSLLSWVVIPFGCTEVIYEKDVATISYSVLVVLAISSLSVYSIILAGWSSNSKYAFIGALRSAAQMVSYEVSLSLTILPVVLLAGSLNFVDIALSQAATGWFCFPLLPLVIIFFISMIAETNRTPFDLPEAEAELVAGYNVDYSSITFAMFFLGEYSNMLIMSAIIVLFFFGGWFMPLLPFLSSALVMAVKMAIFCFLFVLVRATFPRYRYDQLMNIGWKIFLPLTTGYFLLAIGLVITFDATVLISESLGYFY